MTQQAYRGVPHTPWAKDGKVFLSNDEDSHYIQEFRNHDELEAFIQQLRVTAQEAWLDTSSNITFNSQKEEVMRIDAEGFHYKGEFIADAGEAHRLMVAFLKQNTAQPEPQRPTDEELQQFLRNQDRLRFEQESPFGGPDYDGSRARAARVADIRVALARWGK